MKDAKRKGSVLGLCERSLLCASIMGIVSGSFTCLSSEVVLAFLGGGRDTGGRGCMILDV